jgi:glycosyltransferase involved in cell wall biosynthesis
MSAQGGETVAMESPGRRVCLNMIVKNESAIIESCCRAVAPAIDCYVICDTGSTDDTTAIVQRVFDELGVPGEIHHVDFVNFSQARNAALDTARRSTLEFDYVLFCDADMHLEVLDPAWRDELARPVHQVVQRHHHGTLEYINIRLVHRSHPSRYVGATHEYLDIGGIERPVLSGLVFHDHHSGSNRVDKFERDIRLLLGDLADQPDNPRSVFYLANSYFDSGNYDEAETWYLRRLDLGGYEDERYVSMYRLGLIRKYAGDLPGFWYQMLHCHGRYPTRAEPVYELALQAHIDNEHHLAWTMAMIGLLVPKPVSALFVHAEVYEWRLADIASISLYWLGRTHEALALCETIVDIVPADHRERIADNLRWFAGDIE